MSAAKNIAGEVPSEQVGATALGPRLSSEPSSALALYRFAWPRASFLTLGFFDPRG